MGSEISLFYLNNSVLVTCTDSIETFQNPPKHCVSSNNCFSSFETIMSKYFSMKAFSWVRLLQVGIAVKLVQTV